MPNNSCTAFRVLFTLALSLGLISSARSAEVHFVDQGPNWTQETRRLFYSQNEGSQLIPLAWMRALRQADGTPFIASMTRYGYLPNPDPANVAGLPVGFARGPSSLGPMVGMTCSACHTRQIIANGDIYRIDGGPAIVDFAPFNADLDASVARILATDADFQRFAEAVLGANAADEIARARLHAEVELWWVRYHTLVARSLPERRKWGPTRLDAIAVIYNFIAGLDVGPPPTHVIPENIQKGDAPVRYPFLWNVLHQDHTQWTGIASFGDADLRLARNLSEIYGVFAAFRPVKIRGAIGPLDRDYLLHNSTYFDGFDKLDELLGALGSPRWPWRVDAALVEKGKTVFDRPSGQGGCVECHGIQKGEARGSQETWKTPIVNVGTDTRAWKVLLSERGTGSLEGASIPDAVPPLKKKDLGLNILKISVAGALIDKKARSALEHPLPAIALLSVLSSKKEKPTPLPEPNRYEARVLQGVWAAAPYLHNGSVPTLNDLLKPSAERPKSFKIGPNYDPAAVGLAAEQSLFDFTLETTGCDNLDSGDSNCGHDYGTNLPDGEKKALLEYLKTL